MTDVKTPVDLVPSTSSVERAPLPLHLLESQKPDDVPEVRSLILSEKCTANACDGGEHFLKGSPPEVVQVSVMDEAGHRSECSQGELNNTVVEVGVDVLDETEHCLKESPLEEPNNNVVEIVVDDNNVNEVSFMEGEFDSIADSDREAAPSVKLFEGPIGYGGDNDMNPTAKTVKYGCGVCFTIVGSSLKSFQRHYKEHHRVYHTCKICNRKYVTKKGYDNHMMTHICYPCLHCRKEFRHLDDVEKHQQQHFRHTLLRCERCGEEFFLQASLNVHRTYMGLQCYEIQEKVKKIQEQLAKPEELVKCSSGCSNMVPKSRMAEHIKFHYSKKPWSVALSRKKSKRKLYTCNICSDKFNSINSLRAHSKEHELDTDEDENEF